MKEQSNRSEFTIGLDLGERRQRFCALNGKGEVVEEATLGNDRVSLGRLSARSRGAVAVMEAGAHSPWISRYLERLGWEVIVSNPRKVRAIYQHERKSDRRDALMLGADRADGSRAALSRSPRERGSATGICCASNCGTVWCERGWP
jgi:Transposase